MKTTELKITRIGNSRGVRLPAATLRRYGITGAVQMEEKSDAIVLRPVGSGPEKLTWEQTAEAMAADHESWGEWDSVSGDGLENVPWAKMRAAESRTPYQARSRKARRS